MNYKSQGDGFFKHVLQKQNNCMIVYLARVSTYGWNRPTNILLDVENTFKLLVYPCIIHILSFQNNSFIGEQRSDKY